MPVAKKHREDWPSSTPRRRLLALLAAAFSFPGAAASVAIMPFWRSREKENPADGSPPQLAPSTRVRVDMEWQVTFDYRFDFQAGQQLPTIAGKRYLPQPRGPHSVGFVDLMTEGGPTQGSFMRILYPTKEQCLQEHDRWPVWTEDEYLTGMLNFMQSVLARWPSWAPKGEYYGIDRIRHVSPYIPHAGFPTIFRALVGKVYVPIIENAKPDDSTQWPLIVFSHGLGCARSTYSRVCYDLASYGFVVAAVEHRDGSACLSYYIDELGQIQWVQHRRVAESEDEYSVRNSQVHARVSEVSRALSVMSDIKEGRTPKNATRIPVDFDYGSLANAMDVDRPVVAGHSFGGATTVLTLARDSRFSLGIALDAWLFPLRDEDVATMVKKPLLFISTASFRSKENLAKMSELRHCPRGSERLFYCIKGSVHQNHIDAPFVLNYTILRRVMGMHSETCPEVVIDVNNKLMVQFLLRHLERDPDAEIDAEVEKKRELLEDLFHDESL